MPFLSGSPQGSLAHTRVRPTTKRSRVAAHDKWFSSTNAQLRHGIKSRHLTGERDRQAVKSATASGSYHLRVTLDGKQIAVASAALLLSAAVLAGCSSGGHPVELSVTLTGSTHEVTVSRVSCVATSQSVAVVTGSFTANPGAIAASGFPAVLVVPFSKVYDSSGHLIADVEGTHVKLLPNRAEAFRFQAPLSAGTPASCHLS